MPQFTLIVHEIRSELFNVTNKIEMILPYLVLVIKRYDDIFRISRNINHLIISGLVFNYR